MAPLCITDELLREAWMVVASRHPEWQPAGFEAAMQHDVHRRMVRCEACAIAQRRLQQQPPTEPAPAGRVAAQASPAPSLPAPLDRKRAAAGDRADD